MTIVVSSLAQHQRWRHRINVDSTLVMFVTLFRCWADVSLLDGEGTEDGKHQSRGFICNLLLITKKNSVSRWVSAWLRAPVAIVNCI